MKNKKTVNYLILVVVLVVSSIVGFKSLYPSTPNYDDYTKPNITNKLNYIKDIAKEPHSIFDYEAHDNVKNYLVNELKELGVNSKIYTYKDVYVERSKTKEDLQNIYAEIKGKSDSYIMLVTHYDSSRAKTERYAEKDGSVGAADAGYGLSTILETIRVIKENNITLENGIKILITDGEEYGLLGAKEAVKEKEIFDNVNYLVNLEARGTKGPAIMFETSPNNSQIVDLYTNSEKPFSYSITPEIYRLLPNGTDFTVFLDNKINGINISVLDGLENYHTPNDNFDNVNEKSLQHYSDQVYPIVKEFVTNEKYSDTKNFENNDDSIFFIIGNTFVKYSKIVNYILLVVILGLILFLFNKFNIKNTLKPLKFTLINTIFTLSTMAISFGVSKLSAIINGREFKLTYLPLIKYEYIIILAVITLATIVYIMVIKRFTNNFKDKNEYLLGSIIFLFILGLILTFSLPGGSYLFVFPALLISLFTTLNVILNNSELSYIMLVPISLIVILYVPTVYLFNCALTFGALCASMLFAMTAIISVFSCTTQVENLI